jgi:excisionase family DNA binding protein
MNQQTLELYHQYREETGDAVAASNLVLAHAMFAQQERKQEQAITVAEAARRLKISQKKVYRLCEAGDLTHHKVGRAIRIPPEAIDRFVRKSTEEVKVGRQKIESGGSFLEYVKGCRGR